MKATTFPNGLRCVAMNMPWVRVASVSLWFHVGQHHSPPELPPLAHMLEHLCMRGPDGDPTGFTLWLESQGALFNATVHREWTTFTGRVPPSTVSAGLTALRRIAFEDVGWTSHHVAIERDVIRSEMTGHVRDLTRRLPAEAKSLLLPSSAHAIPTSRHLDALDDVTLDQVLSFRRQYLTPANAILLLYGPQAEEEIGLASGIFAGIPPEPGLASAPDPGQFQSQHRRLTDRGGACAVASAFPGPACGSPDQEIMGMAYGLLAYGMGSRLYREAVLQHGLTYQVQTDMEYCTHYGICVLFAKLRDAGGVTHFLDIVQRAVHDVAEGSFSASELGRARERYITHLCLVEENPEQAVVRHGRHLIHTGQPFDLEATVGRLRALNTADIAAVWRRYLDWSRAASVTVVGNT